ncbi:Atp5jp [Homalodisca vitripennis]|nr:Atp5jp [Homalodisca vitripennis]
MDDETWIRHVTPESKQRSMAWQHMQSPKKQKFKTTMSAQKNHLHCLLGSDTGGKLVDPTPEIQKEKQSELDRVARQFGGGSGVDMTKFPEFKFPVRQSVSFDTSRDQHNVTAGTSGVLDGPAIVAVNARHCPLYSASSSPSPSDSPAILSRQLSSLVTLRELRRVFVPFVIRYCFTIVRHT